MMICQSCRRILKDARSIKRGYGPVCWGKVLGAPVEAKEIVQGVVEHIIISGQMTLDDFLNYGEGK